MKHFVLISMIGLFFHCKQAPNLSTQKKEKLGYIANNAMVVSARIEASNIGKKIMQQGGNAFDAMAATELALAVSYPYAGNIGGGGFMVYRTKDGKTGALDYREKAPKNAHKNMYLDEAGEIIPRKSLDGALAVGVPGTIAGIWEAHQKFGKLSWEDVVQPSINLAKNGVVVTKKQEERIQKYREYFQKINPNKIILDGDWLAGDTIKYPALASTLETIKTKGKNGFYTGVLAKQISEFIQAQGGIITTQDLASYQPKWRKPIEFQFNGYTITSMSPPSSGGIVLGQILKTLEHYPIKDYQHNSAQYIQLITEIERRAYADRSYYLGDPDFVNVPIDSLLNDDYLKDRMSDFSWEEATKSKDITYGNIEWAESNETTHYSIVDTEGNAVSVTTTLNGAYGSKLYHSQLGFFYNNEMDDFSAKPGQPNLFGLIGGKANQIEPEKRMLSSMTPTIVSKNNQLVMVLGSPGGSTIITSVLQTILNHTVHGMGMQEAVSAPRFHHQWLPDDVLMEPNSFGQSLIDSLQQKNYNIRQEESVVIGKVDAILRLDNNTLEAGADPRGDDAAAGF